MGRWARWGGAVMALFCTACGLLAPEGLQPGGVSHAARPSERPPQMVFAGNAPTGLGHAALAAIPGGGVALGEGNVLDVNHGGRWEATRLPATLRVDAVVFASSSRGYAYVADMASPSITADLYETENGGKTWGRVGTTLRPSGGAAGYSQNIVPIARGFVATASLNYASQPLAAPFLVQQSPDGRTWGAVTGLIPTFLVTGAAQGPGGELWLAGTLSHGRGQLGYLGPKGYHPVLTTPSPLSDVAFAGSFGMAIGGRPAFSYQAADSATQLTYVTTDGGAQWVQEGATVHTGTSFSQLYLVNRDVAYATAGQAPLGGNGPGYQALYRTTDGGVNWTRVLRTRIDAVVALSARVVEVSTAGVLWQTRDAGATWEPLLPDLWHATWVESSPATPHRAWIAVDLGLTTELLATTNAALTWTPVRSLGHAIPVAWFGHGSGVLETSSGQLVAVTGAHSRRLRLPGDQAASPGVLAAAFSSLGQGIVLVGSHGQWIPYRTRNGGRTWIPLNVPIADGQTLAIRGARIAVLGAHDMAVSTDGGRHWVSRTLAAQDVIYGAAWHQKALWIWGTTGSHSAVWIWSRDHWTQGASPITIQGAALNGPDGWAISSAGNLYHSTDGGDVWQYRSITVTSPIPAPAS